MAKKSSKKQRDKSAAKEAIEKELQETIASLNNTPNSKDTTSSSTGLNVKRVSEPTQPSVPVITNVNGYSSLQLGETDRQALINTIEKTRSLGYISRILEVSAANVIPRNAICAIRLGNDEYYKERYKHSIDYYNTAIILCVNNPLFIVSVLINRAITKLRVQEYKKSILDCTLALSIQPNCIKAYMCRAFGYFFSKEFKKAFSDHYIAYHLTPSNLTLGQVMRLSISSTLLSQSIATSKPIIVEPSKSVPLEWLSEFNLLAIEEEPCRLHLLINYTSNLLERSAISAKSKDKLNKEPGFLIPSGESLYGATWSDFEEYHSQSRSNMSESLSSKQKLLGNTDYQDKNYLSALGHYTKAIRLNPEDPFYYSNRGIAYLKLSRYLEAITDCSISIEMQPSVRSIKAYLRRGAGYSAIGEQWEAVKDYRTALKFEPESLEVLVGLTKTLKYIENDLKLKLELNAGDQQLAQSLKSISNEINVYTNKINVPPQHIAQQQQSTSPQTQQQTPPQQSQQQQQTNQSSPPSSMKYNRYAQQPLKKKKDNPPSPPATPPAMTSPPYLNAYHTNNSGWSGHNQPSPPSTPPSPPPSSSSASTSSQSSPSNSSTQQPQQQSQPQSQQQEPPVKIPSPLTPTVYYKPITQEQKEEQLNLLKYFTHLIAKGVGNPALAYLGRAEVHLQFGDYKGAIDDYKKGLELDPKNPDIQKRYNTIQLFVQSLEK